ncbi:MAG: FG-GAP-like repeat-containing protein, partial [bacterium]
DVIVGADEYINLKGRAYIYYGGAAMNSVADVIMTGEDFSILFGFSVSGAGDVNGDGYSDVIVGAPEFGASAGRAYIFYGSSVMNNIADVVMDGEAANNYFGSSVSEAGDINGDGYSDVVIGAYGFTTNKGKVYIYYGGSVMNNFPDVNMTGENINDKFGVSVSSAGDVNNDGYSDVIVGAEGFDISTGRAYIYYGGNIVNNVADVVMTGESIYFGHSVSDAGDVNGDGYDDIIISAYGYSSYLGKAYIFFGGTSMNNNADITMTGEGENNYFGYSVSGAGDLNGDGYSDLIAGAYQINSYTGKVYFYFSSPQSVKPILNYVKDIPNDQGGKVKLKWARSGYDVAGNNTITDYYIESSEPPIGNNFTWLPVGTVSATKNPFYAFNVTTLFDSSANAFGLFYYRITARTSNPSEFWRSNILYGRSIDNIAPFIVSPFTAVPVSNNVRLNWGRSSAPDFLNYVLYRSISSMIDPETATVFATTSDSTYLDTSPLSGLYYYFIVAQDIHNNKSPVAVAVSPNITLNLTIFIEGFYNAGNNSQVSDTIKASLRNTVSPYAITDESIDVVSSNGSSVFKFGNASDGTYYISINHRNSIETWSATGTILSRTNPASYNFSSSLQQAFGNNLKQVDHSPIRFAIYSGDVNQDGTVDLSDLTLIDNDAGAFTSGYVNTDLTGDDFVDVADLALGDNNAANFVSVVKP